MSRTYVCAVALLHVAVAFPARAEERGEAEAAAADAAHAVVIGHPALDKPKPMRLVAVKDKDGEPLECYMDVDSVSCGDGLCSIVTVRVYWDALGNYDRFDMPKGGRLTKKGNKPFTWADTKKLNSLLADRASPLKGLTKKHVSAPGKSEITVDATTSATPAAIRKAVVPGAVYTCYTLWHWVNGEARTKVREVTGKTCSKAWLSRCVDTGAEDRAVFAMEHLAKRGIQDKAIVEAILGRAQEGSGKAVKGCLRYLEDVSAKVGGDLYFSAMERLFASADNYTLILYIASLAEAPMDPPEGYWDRLSARLPRLDTYYPMHRLLKLMEERNPKSAEVAKQAAIVLDNENFLIARRAFWFLEKQELTAELQAKVGAFRQKHRDRL